MSKKQVVLALGWLSLILSSGAIAGWQGDCQVIESQGPSNGACKAIESKVADLQPYAPFKSFLDTSEDGSLLDQKFSWGSPQWASQGGGAGGGTGVLSPDQGSVGGSDTGSSLSTF